MSDERFASVWDSIENTPAEAENMKLRSALMMACAARSTCSAWMPWSIWRQRLASTWKCACRMPHRAGAFWILTGPAVPKLVGDAQMLGGADWHDNRP